MAVDTIARGMAAAAKIDAAVFKYRGTVSTYNDLPSDAEIGDVYNIATADPQHDINAGDNVAWDGTDWDKLGGDVDLSNYLAKNNTTSFTPTGDYNPATKKYVDDTVTYRPYPAGFDTTHTTQDFLDSIEALNLPIGMAYLGQVSLSDMPDGIDTQAEVEVFIYPQNVIYCVMRSAEVSPYEWSCNSYEFRGWEASAVAAVKRYLWDGEYSAANQELLTNIYNDILNDIPIVVQCTTRQSCHIYTAPNQASYVYFYPVFYGVKQGGWSTSTPANPTLCSYITTYGDSGNYNNDYVFALKRITFTVNDSGVVTNINKIDNGFYVPRATSIALVYGGGGSPYAKRALCIDNTNSYTPTADYHPATKKYVDDSVATKQDVLDKVIVDVQANGVSIVEISKLVKDMAVDNDVSNKVLSIDMSGYTSTQLVDGITGGNALVAFSSQEEDSAYTLFASDGSYLSDYAQTASVAIYNPDGTAFGTVESSDIYVWYVVMTISGGVPTYTGVYVLDDLTTKTAYGTTTLPNNYLINEIESAHYPTSVIWNCIKLSGFATGDGVANIITNTAYDPTTNKIATMTDINNVVGDISTILDTFVTVDEEEY